MKKIIDTLDAKIFNIERKFEENVLLGYNSVARTFFSIIIIAFFGLSIITVLPSNEDNGLYFINYNDGKLDQLFVQSFVIIISLRIAMFQDAHPLKTILIDIYYLSFFIFFFFIDELPYTISDRIIRNFGVFIFILVYVVVFILIYSRRWRDKCLENALE